MGVGLVFEGITSRKPTSTETFRRYSRFVATVKSIERENVGYGRARSGKQSGVYIVIFTWIWQVYHVLKKRFAGLDHEFEESNRKLMETDAALHEILERQKQLETRQQILSRQANVRRL